MPTLETRPLHVDLDVDALVRDGDLERAAIEAVRRYGPELRGFLAHVLGNLADAQDVFSETILDFWRSLPAFEARCSVRTWLYLLARHAAARFRRVPWNNLVREEEAMLESLHDEARAPTARWLRTELKDRWQVLRDALAPDDRALLVLRVDRGLSWSDVARVMLDDERPSPAELEREAMRLRKRFQLLKTRLRAQAREAGLIEGAP